MNSPSQATLAQFELPTVQTAEHSLAPLIVEAERVLAEAVRHFELSVSAARIVITIQVAGKMKALGWFSADRWKNNDPQALHEINLCAEHLKTCDMGELLLHEIAHAENKELGINDTAGNRHNKKFKRMAEKLGLIVEETHPTAGYGITNIGESGAAFLEKIAFKRELFAMARLGSVVPRPAPGSRLVKVECPDCGYTARVTQKWIARGLPTCPCGSNIRPEDDSQVQAVGSEESENSPKSTSRPVVYSDSRRLDWLERMADACDGILQTLLIPNGRTLREKIDEAIGGNS